MTCQLLVKVMACMAVLCSAGAADLPNTPSEVAAEGLSCSAADAKCTRKLETDYMLQVDNVVTKQIEKEKDVSETPDAEELNRKAGKSVTVTMVIDNYNEMDDDKLPAKIEAAFAEQNLPDLSMLVIRSIEIHFSIEDAEGNVILHPSKADEVDEVAYPIKLTWVVSGDPLAQLQSKRAGKLSSSDASFVQSLLMQRGEASDHARLGVWRRRRRSHLYGCGNCGGDDCCECIRQCSFWGPVVGLFTDACVDCSRQGCRQCSAAGLEQLNASSVETKHEALASTHSSETDAADVDASILRKSSEC